MEPQQRFGLLAVAAMVLGSSCFCVSGLLMVATRPPHEIPVHEPRSPVVEEAPPPPARPPVDPARVAAGLARVGALESWTAGEAPCPITLPLPSTEVSRAPPDAFGAERAIVPASPFALRKSAEPERLFEALADEITEPTLYILELERVAPTLEGPRLFSPGHSRGRAFLRTPDVDGFVCVGEFTAQSGASVSAGASTSPLQRLEDSLAVDLELELQVRLAAAQSLRAAAPRE